MFLGVGWRNSAKEGSDEPTPGLTELVSEEERSIVLVHWDWIGVGQG